jgi:chromosome segregation ATPase
LSSVQGATSEAQQLQQQAEEQASTIRSLQATLTSLRSELEISHTSLFELTARQEQAAGSASTAEQFAVEEVERLSSALLSVRKENALLERQLQQLQEQQQQADRADALGGGGSAAAGEGGWDEGSDPLADLQQQQQKASAAAGDGQLAAAEAALAAAEEEARDQQHQVALLTSKLSAAETRLERVNAELQRRPSASAVVAMAEQLAALSALAGGLACKQCSRPAT